MESSAPRPSAALPLAEPGATPVSSAPPSHTPADEDSSPTSALEPAKMWMSVRQCQVCVLEVTASTQWDHTSVSAPRATVRAKPTTNVKILMNAAPSLVYVMEENAPTLLVATSAPVHVATSPAQMVPDVLTSVWVPVSLLWLMDVVLRNRAASTPRCSVAVIRAAAGHWDRSLKCVLSGGLMSSGVYV